jgi:hypothetical protein
MKNEKTFYWLFVISAVLGMCDMAVTYWFVGHGYVSEGNGVMASAIEQLGILPAVTINILISLLLYYGVYLVGSTTKNETLKTGLLIFSVILVLERAFAVAGWIYPALWVYSIV